MEPRTGILLLCITVFLASSASLPASSRGLAQQAASASNLKQVALAFLVRYTSARNAYDPEVLQTMPDLLRELAKADLRDAGVFLSRADLEHIDLTPPRIIAQPAELNQTKVELLPEFLQFPIAFSAAVYPDLNRMATQTPLFWTRDLHRYVSFDRPYGGHIVFLDGHVQYFHGTPDAHSEELQFFFGPESPFAHTLRTLEHEPEAWTSRKIAPLPVRVEADRLSAKRNQKIGFLLWVLAPGAIIGAISAAFPARSTGTRIIRFFAYATLVTLGIALLISPV